MLNAIPTPLQSEVPSVSNFQPFNQALQCSTKSLAGSTNSNGCSEQPGTSNPPSTTLDWSALPAAVDADSTAMGISTRKQTAKRQAKQRPVDQAKVQARVERKRAQVGAAAAQCTRLPTCLCWPQYPL